MSAPWQEVTTWEAGGVIPHNLSVPYPPAVTNTLLSGFPAEHTFLISTFILCRNVHKRKSAMFGLAFPLVGFVEVKSTISCIC